MGVAIALGVIGSVTAIAASAANAASQMSANDANRQIARETNNSNRQIAEETNQANAELAAKENEWNVAQWNRENEYNAPAAQLKRLKAAGLSDAAASQAIDGAGNASSITSANLSNQQTGNPMIGANMLAPLLDSSAFDMLGYAREFEQYKKDSAEANVAEQTASATPRLLLTEMDAKQADLEMKRLQYSQSMQSFPYSLFSLKYRALADKYLPEQKEADLEMSRTNRQLVEQNVKLARQQFGFLEKFHEQEINKIQEEIRGLFQQRANAKKQGALIGEQVEGQKKQNELLDQSVFQQKIESILKSNGCPEDFADRTAVLLANGVINYDQMRLNLNSLKSYVIAGHTSLGVNPVTRTFLNYYWDKGQAAFMTQSPYSIGAAHSALDGMDKFFRNFSPFVGK